MYSIEATHPNGSRWISGVFQNREKAEAYLRLVPDTDRAHQRIVEVPVATYPVFVIEDRGFEYGNVDFIKARLSKLRLADDKHFVHMNVYAVREDFAPSMPGWDIMGVLLHWHITDHELRPPMSITFNKELDEILPVA